MESPKNPDFSGWATRNDLVCSDGRVIKRDAFKDCDGKTVPLVWNHQHNDPENVLGHAILQNREEGVYAYCYFNDSENGKNAKHLVQHGDIRSMSIYANRLTEFSKNVTHGNICEVSLVHAPANPGAFIDSVLAHGDSGEETGLILGYDESFTLYHSDESEKKEEKQQEEDKQDEETAEDVLNTLNEKQKKVVYTLIELALESGNDKEKENEEEDNKSMKHNVFDNEQTNNENVISHSDQMEILKVAKNSQVGSFQNALRMYVEENDTLQHDGTTATASGFTDATIGYLFPDYKDVRPGAPEVVNNDQTWVKAVMSKVHKSPYNRIRTRQVDVRNITALRGKGYQKGKKKGLTGNYALVHRTTDPQTVYVKNALNRDDIVDIEDFDYVQYQYDIDKTMLEEELARAILIGDGRELEDADKINPEHIRPIWTDDDLYTIHVDVDLATTTSEIQGTDTDNYFGENFIYAESIVNAVLYARENYHGSGTLDFFCAPHTLNVMLLARDRNGVRLYRDTAELARALNVANIYTVEDFANQTRTSGTGLTAKTKKLVAMLINLNDYSLGATRKGQVTHFTQFDIDFNQEKSLIETRTSGALTRVYSAIAIEEDVTENP